jgi:hypothetical protein
VAWPSWLVGAASRRLRCNSCYEEFSDREVWFWCDFPYCPGKDKELPGKPPNRLAESLFRPKGQFADRLPCPWCRKPAYKLVCPRPKCGQFLTLSLDSSTSVALVGTPESGKTCFVTGLLHQVMYELSSPDRFRFSLRLDEDSGSSHFLKQHKRIFEDHELPDPTQ